MFWTLSGGCRAVCPSFELVSGVAPACWRMLLCVKRLTLPLILGFIVELAYRHVAVCRAAAGSQLFRRSPYDKRFAWRRAA